ncbi:protein GVQW3-like [Oratosquilla oratoria]|uniref:protein GVQW3-like n=1 Tax=Oratosquilla oratoria TaxID=337810 RepID=UPI003F763B6F
MIKKTFQDDSMREAQIKMRYKRFKESRESVENDPRSGRPSTIRTPENFERVKTTINENRRLTVLELDDDLGIPRTSVSKILTEDLGMTRVVTKFVPRLLTHEQREFRTKTSQDMLQAATNYLNFLKQVLTGDESWVFGCDSETKTQSRQWKSPASPCPKKA